MGFKWAGKQDKTSKKKTAVAGGGGLTLGFILARVFQTWRSNTHK